MRPPLYIWLHQRTSACAHRVACDFDLTGLATALSREGIQYRTIRGG